MYSYDMVCALSKYAAVQVVLSGDVENRYMWETLASTNDNVQVEFIQTYSSTIGFVFRTLMFYLFGASLLRKLKREKFDAVYSPMGHFWNKKFYRNINGALKITTIHDIILHHGEDGIITRFARWLFSHRVDRYVILSEVFVDDLARQGVPRSSIFVIPHAAFCSYSSISNSHRPRTNAALFFGRIVKYKGLGLLLESLGSVLKGHPGFKLYIVGQGDISQYGGLLEKYSDNLVVVNHWISDQQVGEYFGATDFTIMPYIHASQSGVVALSYGFSRPVIVTDIGGLPSQVVDGRTGYICKAESQSLSDSICAMLDSTDQYESMVGYIGEYVKKELTWDSSARKLIEIIDNGKE